jgi:ribosomal protein S18 acetylase RimI-like enzyme
MLFFLVPERCMDVLDNPIWHALTTRHAPLALAAGELRRYAAGTAPFCAIGRDGEAAVSADILQPGEHVYFLGAIPTLPPGWRETRRAEVLQMVWEGAADGTPDDTDVATLTAADLPDMLALTALVYPAYFRPGAIAMGGYLGIRHEGRLIAMAGQRMHPGTEREISGICTHPDHVGRGHASRLTRLLVRRTLDEGDRPFLHVDAGNARAHALYASLGFAPRTTLTLVQVTRD